MINYRKGKVRYKTDKLGSLYIKNTHEDKTLVYIGGQMEHNNHLFERSGFTSDKVHNILDGSYMYEYPVTKKDKSGINARSFSLSLLNCLKEANLYNVDIISNSHGGLVGAYASLSNRINKVYMIHSPIFGTPLASPKLLSQYKNRFNEKENTIRIILKLLVDELYGFQKDNLNGLSLSNVDLNKIVYIGSGIDKKSEKSNLVLTLYDMIYKVTGIDSDGIVLFDEEKLIREGINYIKDEKGMNHFEAGSLENVKNILKLIYK